jgi:undecaprenyl-diphosphatase
MPDAVLQFDYHLFFLINGKWHTTLLDALLPLFRNPYFWAPLYLFLALFAAVNFRWRGWWWMVFFVLTFALIDSSTAQLLKPFFGRARPCHNPVTGPFDRLLAHCSSGFSFPSNHAANHFGLAAFMFFTLCRPVGRWMWVAFLWAFAVSYAQVYVGVHFPLDVTGGALYGLIIGSLTAFVFNRKIGLPGI